MLSEIVGRAGYVVSTASTESDAQLADIPAEVPALNSVFLARGAPQSKLKDALLSQDRPVKALGMGIDFCDYQAKISAPLHVF